MLWHQMLRQQMLWQPTVWDPLVRNPEGIGPLPQKNRPEGGF
jgi:hypothetical protein